MSRMGSVGYVPLDSRRQIVSGPLRSHIQLVRALDHLWCELATELTQPPPNLNSAGHFASIAGKYARGVAMTQGSRRNGLIVRLGGRLAKPDKLPFRQVTLVRPARLSRTTLESSSSAMSQSSFDRLLMREASTSHPGRQGSLTLEQQATE
jgi:hypothetical protein